jgi:hypothetical protein
MMVERLLSLLGFGPSFGFPGIQRRGREAFSHRGHGRRVGKGHGGQVRLEQCSDADRKVAGNVLLLGD